MHSRREIAQFMTSTPLRETISEAARLRMSFCGNRVFPIAAIEFSNVCIRPCAYCGLRRLNSLLTRYRMTVDEIVEAGRNCAEKHYASLLLQSGEDPSYSTDDLAEVVAKASGENRLSVGLSVGARSSAEYKVFRDAGAEFYLLREETSDGAAFARLHDGQPLQPRLASLLAAKAAGLAVGGGVLLGLPGQTVESRADDLIWAQEVGLDYFSITAFVPNPDTPLADAAPLSFEHVLRFIAAARITLPDAHIVLSPGILANDNRGWEFGIVAGANALLVPETPSPYGGLYAVYPDRMGKAPRFPEEIAEVARRAQCVVSDSACSSMMRTVSIPEQGDIPCDLLPQSTKEVIEGISTIVAAADP